MNDRRDDDATGGALSPEEWVRLQFEALQEDVADEERARGRRAATSPADSEPEAPSQRDEPIAPVAPAQPAQPTEPAAPTESAALTEPAAPTTAQDPAAREEQPAPAGPPAPTWGEQVVPPVAPAQPSAEPVRGQPTPPPARRRAEPTEPAVDFGLPPTALPPQAFSAPSAPSPSAATAASATGPEGVGSEPEQPAAASARPDLDTSWGEPTQAMALPKPGDDDSWGEPTQAMSLPKADDDADWGEPTQAMAVPATAIGPSTEDTGLDDLFGENRFREVDAGLAGEAPQRPGDDAPRERAPREPMPRNVKILAWVAGVLVALLALLALFWAGLQLPGWTGAAAPSPSPTATSQTPTPTPEPAEETIVGPVAPGTYAWDELGGGECLEQFPSAWAEEYTVVDCAQPHAAQLISLAELGESTEPYPGLEALAAETNVRCAAPEAISLELAGAYDDIVLEASYAATEQAWQDGDNAYACFARRSGGEAIEGSLQP